MSFPTIPFHRYDQVYCISFGPVYQHDCQCQNAGQFGLSETSKRPVTDTYFGKKVIDNYRWLEDMSSPETQAWFKAQGDYTNAMLAQIPGRDKLIQTFVGYERLFSVRYGEITGYSCYLYIILRWHFLKKFY